MAKPLKRVTRWTEYVREALRNYGLQAAVHPIVVLAQIHTESRGWERPEDHLPEGAIDYSAEGLLQMQPIAARDAGLTVEDIDGKGDPKGDAIRSIDSWAKLQLRYNGKSAPYWDYPLLWLAGSGTLGTARSLRESGHKYWAAWTSAADQSNVGSSYLIDYAWTYYEANAAYYRWTTGQQRAV